MKQFPVFIICRDRVTYTKELVAWLEKVGQEEIYLVDNESTYEPLLDWYKQQPHQVIHMGGNTGHTGVWNCGVIEKFAQDRRFIVTDPDVIPTEYCPLDAIDKFDELLDRYEDRQKVGFSLKLDDIPDHFRFKQDVLGHELRYQAWAGPEPWLSYAPIDTTFALYRVGATQDISFSCRTRAPYEARHMSWYINSNDPGEEEEYYITHAHPRINSWNHKELPFWLGGNR